MVRMASLFAACTAFAAAFALPLSAADNDSDRESKGDRELAELLAGREAGEPVKCLRSSQRDSMRIINDTAFIFRDGKTLYVNRTRSPRFLDEFDVPVFKQFGSNLCRLDRVEMRDGVGLSSGPVVILDDFIPYRMIETAN